MIISSVDTTATESKFHQMKCTANCRMRCLNPSHSAACSGSTASRELTFLVTLLHFVIQNHRVPHRLALSPDGKKVMGSNPRPFFVQLALSPCVCVGSPLVVWLIGFLKLSVGVNVWCGWLVVYVTLSRDKLVTHRNLLASRDNWEKLPETQSAG